MQDSSPGMSLKLRARPGEWGWEWGWEWDWDSQQGQEMGLLVPVRFYAAPLPVPASLWPVDVRALPLPSFCPPLLSVWQCSQSGP